MAKYTVEYRIVSTSETGREIRQLKRTLDNPEDIRALVTEAAGVVDGNLEFLTVRKVPEKKPAAPPKKLILDGTSKS